MVLLISTLKGKGVSIAINNGDDTSSIKMTREILPKEKIRFINDFITIPIKEKHIAWTEYDITSSPKTRKSAKSS